MEVGGLKYRDTSTEFKERWDELNRDRPHILLAHLGGKYTYVKAGHSPTQHGYQQIATGLDPKLPVDALLSKTERDQNYTNIQTNLDWTAQQLESIQGGRFVDSAAVLERVAPEDYWEITADEALAVSRWLLQEWSTEGVPPDFITDGTEYYSLRDAAGILLGDPTAVSLPLPRLEGPLKVQDSETEGCLSLAELQTLAETLRSEVVAAHDDPWTVKPATILPGSFRTSIGTLNLAQLLRALAVARVAQEEDWVGDGVYIDPAAGLPETASLLIELGAMNAADTSWSLKPARIRVEP